MNKSVDIRRYMPLLRYLFGDLKDLALAKRIWAECSLEEAKSKFSKFKNNANYEAEVKRRIFGLLWEEPWIRTLGFRQRKNSARDTALWDVAFDDDAREIKVDEVSVNKILNMTLEEACRVLEPKYRIAEDIELLERSLNAIVILSEKKSQLVATLWLGIDVILTQAREVPIERMRQLRFVFDKAFSATARFIQLEEALHAQKTFERRTLISNRDERDDKVAHKVSHKIRRELSR